MKRCGKRRGAYPAGAAIRWVLSDNVSGDSDVVLRYELIACVLIEASRWVVMLAIALKCWSWKVVGGMPTINVGMEKELPIRAFEAGLQQL